MWKISVNIGEHAVFSATHILADLRTVSEVLFHPLKQVGFWDNGPNGAHLCPHQNRGLQCPHKLAYEDPDYSEYSVTLERELNAVLEVHFPHAQVYIYLK